MNLKKRSAAIALALCLTTAISLMSLGFAAWHTEITASGSVAAAGTWNVAVTNATLEVSTGASTSTVTTTYALTRTGDHDSAIAERICTATAAEDAALVGTQSGESIPSSSFGNRFYAVDATKYADLLANMTGWTAENTLEAAAMMEDETSVCVFDTLKAYYRTATDGTTATDAAVVDQFLADVTALLREKFPDTYQNYTLCFIYGAAMGAERNYTAANMTASTQSTQPDTLVTWDDASATYANVTFGLPGAWAKYTLTVTNNGTVDANLSGVDITLDTDSEQLVLDKPDLTGEVLKSGESCTITFVVKVPDIVTEDLDAAGTLSVKLVYDQTAVEEAPSAGHTHG